jgi:hypothetical protein
MSEQSIKQQIDVLSSKLSETIEHQKREEKFASEANIRFEKNLACFKKYYPDIADAIVNFKTRDDFCLHVTPTGYGNFQPKGINAPIYSADPIEQTRKQIDEQLLKPVLSLTDYTGYPQDDSDTRIHSRYMTALTRYMVSVREKGAKTLTQMPDTFPTAVIFGIGLGYHVPILFERVKFEYAFIVEPDFEQFFASLFCTDWFSVIQEIDASGRSLFFHLGVNHESFINDLELVSEDIGAFSLVRSFCYQHTPGHSLNQLIHQWCADYFRFQFGHGFYNDAITGLAHSIHHVSNQAAIYSRISQKLDYETPIFIVGNGPSLDEAEEFLKKNNENAIIVAAGTAIASLYKKGIKSDFHVLVERPYSNYKVFGDIMPPNEYKKVNLLGLNTLYPDTNLRYKWAGIAMKGNEAGSCLIDILSKSYFKKALPLIPYINPVVANAALSYVLSMGFRNVYLFGIDNGQQPDGMHHSKDSIYKRYNDSDEKGFNSYVFKGKKLAGNFGGFVISNDLFQVAHIQLEKLIKDYSAASVINVGNGAKLSGAIPSYAHELMDCEQLEQDKESVVEKIKREFFVTLPIEDVDINFLGLDKLEEACDHLVSIASEKVTSQQEALEQLRRQSRYLYSFRDTQLGHIFHIIKGSLLYYHCPMISLLYSYQDPEFCVTQYTGLNELWIKYLLEIKTHAVANYTEKCDLGKGNDGI